LIYDLRAANPLFIKDHQYGYPIKNIEFHSDWIISSDTKITKIWERETNGKVYASIEPPADINDVCILGNSGLIFYAAEQSRMLTYFIPSLGPAPRWCSFLENLTEELEEDKQVLYDDYKFISKEELEKLGASNLIGTEYLRASMHGFFIDMRLYSKLRAVVEPFEFENYVKEKAKERIKQEEQNRIGARRKLPKVNANIAVRMIQNSKSNQALLEDPRFKKLWESNDFVVDEEDEKYKFYRPIEKKITQEDIEEHFEKVEDEDEPHKEVDFYELKHGHEYAVLNSSASQKEKAMTLGKRVKNLEPQTKQKVSKITGGIQASFVPNEEKKKKRARSEHKEEWVKRLSERRGVQGLGFKKIRRGNK